MAGTMNKGSLVKNPKSSGGGGGSASFPTIVTDSGSSLPSASGYQLNDTFLNTSDKKIYKTTADKYKWNTDVYNYNSVTTNFFTGVVTNISNVSFYRSFSEHLWEGTKTYQIKFQLSSIPSSGSIGLFGIRGSAVPGYWRSLSVKSDVKKIRYTEGSISYGSASVSKDIIVLDTELETDVDYTIVINKSGQSCQFVLLKNNIEIEHNTIDVTEITTNCDMYIGCALVSSGYGWSTYLYSYGQIYLLDSSGEFLIPDSELSWDSGTDITDKTEYVDKTNGTLYLYENSELVKIGGALKKKVYTISADNTSTLDVSSDFTKIVDVLKNGVELALTDDYTISSGVITFVTALSTTDKITVKGE